MLLLVSAHRTYRTKQACLTAGPRAASLDDTIIAVINGIEIHEEDAEWAQGLIDAISDKIGAGDGGVR